MQKILSLAPWLLLSYAAAALGGIASANAPEFYALLHKPAWAPPASLFGPVWTVLYGLMGIAAWLIWDTRDRAREEARTALGIFIVQLALNALWSWIFFVWHRGAWALAEIVVLWIFIALTLYFFYKLRKIAGLLLLPYLAWVSFATALTYSLWQNNPELL